MNKKISALEQENDILRKTIEQLEQENDYLEKSHARQRIVLEQFEGEGKPMFDVNGEAVDPTWWEQEKDPEGQAVEAASPQAVPSTVSTVSVASAGSMASNYETRSFIARREEEECTTYADGACPIEPDISFKDALKDRAVWLVGLLSLQSMSGFILARNEELLQTHPVIVYFLTMLVGAGGNAGNQAAVRGMCFRLTWLMILAFLVELSTG